MAGFITLDRKILKWEWYSDINTCRVFIHLLLTANHADGMVRGTLVKRGQVLTGRLKLSKDLRLAERPTRTSLERLQTTGEITIKTTNKHSVITIVKYDLYQSVKGKNDQQNDQQNANKTPTNVQQEVRPTTTNNNSSNNNNNVLLEKKEGGQHPPVTPDSVPGYNKLSDGRSYIDREVFFTAADFNGLPEDKNEAIRTTLVIVKDIEKTAAEVSSLWEVFKTMNLTFQKPYRNHDDVYNHFSNWCKTQTFKAQRKPSNAPTPARAEKLANMTEYERNLHIQREAAKNRISE
jgi:hypothetical protein